MIHIFLQASPTCSRSLIVSFRHNNLVALPNTLVSSFLQKLGRQDEDEGFFDKNVEMVLEDALETIVEHYVEDAINFEGGEDDEDSPWYEWVLQDAIKSALEHLVIERLLD